MARGGDASERNEDYLKKTPLKRLKASTPRLVLLSLDDEQQ